MTLSTCLDLTITAHCQDVHSKVLLLLPVDIEDCAYISLYSPDTRERIVSSNISNDQSYHNWYVVVFLTHAFNYTCMYMHTQFLFVLHLESCYASILSLYPQGLNEQGMNPGLSPHLTFFKLLLIDTYYCII